MSADTRVLKEVFGEALALHGGDRDAYLGRACGGDAALRARLESLLRTHEGAEGFLSSPTVGGGAAGGGRIKDDVGGSIGPYRLLSRIGEGGFGSVYLAEQSEPVARRVALKVIKRGMDTDRVIARFEAERRALALMEHPGIARVLDAGATESGRPYFVMELVAGEPITAYCESNGLSLRARLELFVEVCRAVQHAHTKGIIHRDLKPSNVLVATVDGRPAPKIIDFGIAKATGEDPRDVEERFTEARQLVGTPEYMAPEQAAGAAGDADTRTDIYGLGVLLYELLTGETPVPAARLRSAPWDEMLRIIREEPARRPSTRLTAGGGHAGGAPGERRARRALRGDLDWIAMKCLEKEPARRYESAAAMAADVRRHLAGEAVLAAPPGRVYRARKFVGRHRGPVLAAALVGAAVVAGLAVSVRATVRARRAEQRAVLESTMNAQTAKVLADMLESVDPYLAMGHDTTLLRAILERTAVKMDDDLRDQPVVRARLKRTIASALFELGERDRAGALWREAIELARSSPDGREEELEAGLSVALTGIGVATAAESQRMYLDLLAGFRALNKPTFGAARALGGLGTTALTDGRFEEAERYLRQAIAEFEAAGGGRTDGYLRELADLALALHGQGRSAEAELLLQRCIVMRRDRGDSELVIAHPKSAYAQVLLGLGRAAEAELLIRDAVRVREQGLAPGHFRTHQARSILGECLAHQGCFAEAESLLVPAYYGLAADPLARRNYRRAALAGLVALYETWDAAEPSRGYDRRAAEWRAELAAVTTPDGATGMQPR